ncbi:hypothetical protein [Halorussus sp. MSC15.2]|uniref:DUF7319 domain-containing protein n=1 Tax=Halorussus sp. MSC15.2 TaxID=2283638 RepID=UPI0013D727C9|nr:hypothetical protein [Halorussus sp. MSC15.2]NEU56629.1 hypothetical protein [Halorussus sp. MSC15.2]
MTDASDDPAGESPADATATRGEGSPERRTDSSPDEERDEQVAAADEDGDGPTPEEVEEKYDFEDFGPRDMAEMSYEEWQVAFDHDSWITGEQLLDRVETDLNSRVADRDVFAVVERIEREGEPQLLAYSDEGYAVVYPDGSVEGSGTVLRDVKPSVALASMESYEVPESPEGDVLPDPAEVPEGSGKLGNQLMQIIAAVHVLAGVALLASWVAVGLPIVAAVAALGFLFFGVFVFLLVANARLSDRFRAEEYRNRLRAVGLEDDERPEFLLDDGDRLPDDAETSDSSPDEEGDGATGTGVSSASDSAN